MSNVVISVENLSKEYTLGVFGHGLLYRDLQSWLARKRGKEDPNAVIGTERASGGRFLALNDVSFEVKQGDVLGVIGKNGAGKSTLLKVMSRVTAPTKGVLKIKGRIASLLEVGTGFHPELTGRENIYLNGAILGMNRREIDSKFDEIVDFAEVETFIDTPVKRYSSGMYVRLAFAVAAHLEPEILIVDEVLAVGDAQFQKKCLGKMEKVGSEGRTVLFVSHNMGAISRLCSRCIVLDEGQLLTDDTTQNAVSKYLAGQLDKNGIYEQDADDKKDINLRRVIISPDSGDRALDIKYDDPVRIRVEYEVNRKVSNCTVWLALEASDGTMVFTTTDYDLDRDMLLEREPGYYTSDIEIPGGWLNTGQYVVIVGIVNNYPLIVYDRVEAIRFETNEVGSPASFLGVGGRRGVLQPAIRWDVSRVDR
jgi:lipopolysaccharide transport system ATP-binding protein